MGRVFCTGAWTRFLKGHCIMQPRHLCSSSNNSNKIPVVGPVRDDNVYRQLENLDFMTAAKILFTTPPKRKKFGGEILLKEEEDTKQKAIQKVPKARAPFLIRCTTGRKIRQTSFFPFYGTRLDFHLVQLFFVCMPSLAVFLVAQYARYEIRRMEAEAEMKKKQQAEEEEKKKQTEPSATEESMEIESDPELSKVKVRLDALEEAVKEIAVETKKLSGQNLTKHAQEDSKRGQIATRSGTESTSEDTKSSTEGNSSIPKSTEMKPGLSQERVNGSGSVTNASQQDQR